MFTATLPTSLLLLCCLLSTVSAHMSIWHPSMYGVGPDWAYDAGPPMNPIGPGLATQDEWWFRGPEARALPPQDGAVMELPAGGSITFEIACHYAFTSYGYATSVPGSELDACPGSNAGPYHAGDPESKIIDHNLVSGCALAIADVDDISKVTMDNLAIFSVQHECVQQKMTDFEVPARMPACTGEKCICGWFWLANNGTANFYMTAFDCTVTGSPADATAIAAPQDPVFCKDDPISCTKGSKRPIYAYNSPSNVPWIGNDDRAGYHASWSFGTAGAQNDIFELPTLPPSSSSTAVSSSSTTAPTSSRSTILWSSSTADEATASSVPTTTGVVGRPQATTAASIPLSSALPSSVTSSSSAPDPNTSSPSFPPYVVRNPKVIWNPKHHPVANTSTIPSAAKLQKRAITGEGSVESLALDRRRRERRAKRQRHARDFRQGR
ncbi:hypothetical protein BMF94_5858 [Rhodotorula taiwanensis]|uniref:Uncharacterized protein n=1 Tax=Rhodotorula taiwanensis TaxID=741276 RepID=A0A2S5B329_9BASI|nr:hypothetical protein BMF94_5858 [Rhodotorula taiwanensis]